MDTEITTNPQYKAITCPVCGSKEIAFVSEYHKLLGLRIICYIIIVVIAFSVYDVIKDYLSQVRTTQSEQSVLFVSVFLYLIFQISILVGESKTHVKAICRNCGNLWLLD